MAMNVPGAPIPGGDLTSLARLLADNAFKRPFPLLLVEGPGPAWDPKPREDIRFAVLSDPSSPFEVWLSGGKSSTLLG
jgi:hypothetical protein